jgi:hypothetical protein
MFDHDAPFHAEKNVALLSLDLPLDQHSSLPVHTSITHLPAAKMLLAFPALTSSAVTGPGSPDPTAAHELLPNV